MSRNAGETSLWIDLPMVAGAGFGPAAAAGGVELTLRLSSARMTPAELRLKPTKTRKLKNAPREVDFFFIVLCRLFPIGKFLLPFMEAIKAGRHLSRVYPLQIGNIRDRGLPKPPPLAP